MIIAGKYSFNKGKEIIEEKYSDELKVIEKVIHSIDAEKCKTKKSKEITMDGKLLYSPKELNKMFKASFAEHKWTNHKEYCEYATEFYTNEYTPNKRAKKKGVKPYRDMDFVKNRVGVEVQFGKYAFMVYNVCAKMTIFNKLDIIDVGVEIVPIKQFADEMSTGVSYFEQFVWDLQQRGNADIDIPVLIIGIDTDGVPEEPTKETQERQTKLDL